MTTRVSQALCAQSSISFACTRKPVKVFHAGACSRISNNYFGTPLPMVVSRTQTKAANTDTDAFQSIDVENMSKDFCDDFVCTSSPAIEQTVKSFGRDIIRLKHTTAIYQPDTQYKDGFRSFQGRQKYANLDWTRTLLVKPTADVTRLQMLGKGLAQADWVLTGKVANTDVRIPISSKITMNLLTGRITEHSETWDLKAVSPPLALLLTASRLLWALKAASRDAGEDISKVTASLSSMEDDSNNTYMNPQDPTRFFQQNNNNQMTDAFTVATVLAAIYAVFKAFESIEMLK